MAICKLNTDVLKSNFCGYSLGSISRIYIANYEDVTATAVDTTSGQVVTAITLASGATYYKIDPGKNSASWQDELVVEDSGAKYRTQTVNFNVIGSYTKELVDVVDALSLGKYNVVLEKNDGSYVMLGRNAGLEAQVVTVGGSDDNSIVNGIQCTLNANTAEAALPLSEAAIATVKGE